MPAIRLDYEIIPLLSASIFRGTTQLRASGDNARIDFVAPDMIIDLKTVGRRTGL